MESIERYRHLNKYLKEKFGERTLKICIDGRFTCPNRDGSKGISGCIFCSEKGSGEHINLSTMINKSINNNFSCTNIDKTLYSPKFNNIDYISNQVKNYFNSYKAERANKFIAYFQNFTNTYDSIENLKQKYDAALIDDRIVGLEIATRPDCITEDIAKLLKSYSDKYYVCVELGLQTSNERTGNLINRCYTNADFTNAVSILNNYGIDVVAHIIIGLPTIQEPNVRVCNNSDYNIANSSDNVKLFSIESIEDISNTVEFINMHNIHGLKIHSCYIVKNTILEKLYNEAKYVPLSLEQYLNQCAYVLTHIKPNIVVHRVSGDAPKDLLIAPTWNLHKKWIINGLDKLLHEKNLFQGMYYLK